MKRKQIYFKMLFFVTVLSLFYLIVTCMGIQKASITATATTENATYARIESNCYLYEKEDSDSGIFILPESYYVKILKKGSTFHQVSYLDDGDFATAIQGYVLANSVHIQENYIPQNPYLQYTISVTFKINAVYSTLLDEIRLELPFYGISKVNTKVFNYVNYNQQIVAVDSKACSVVNYPKHPDSLVQNVGSTTTPSNSNVNVHQPNYTPLIVTSFIGGLCLVGLGISYFIFNGSKKHKPIQVFDELDEN